MPDNYNFGQLTKEIIVSQLKNSPNASIAAAELARKTIISGVHATKASGQNPKETVEEICYGTMSGVLLIAQDLTPAALEILRYSAEISNQLGIDPSDLMTWAMTGIAKIATATPMETLYKIRAAIEEEYEGVAEVFTKICEPYEKKA
jgi:hypothetical protein